MTIGNCDYCANNNLECEYPVEIKEIFNIQGYRIVYYANGVLNAYKINKNGKQSIRKESNNSVVKLLRELLKDFIIIES